MTFLDLLQSRRSVRRFQRRPIDPALVIQLMEAALRAPSSRGRNPWEFIVVDDADMLDALARAKPHGSSFVKDAALAIVVLADPERSDVWVEDTSIATIFIHLAAHSLGLGSCWVQIRERAHSEGKSADAYISEHLGIPADRRVEAIVAIGHPEQTPAGHGSERLERHKVHRRRYGVPFSAMP